jgi:nucleotidyltransferase substrate binding protein (TIGR01987 family)
VDNLSFAQMTFFRKLCDLPFVDWIWLYGSRARGEAGERSDIDLAVVCPQASEKDWMQVEKIIEEQEDILLKIDLIRFDQLAITDAIRLKILQDKIALFERKPQLKDPLWRIYFYDLGDALQRLEEALNTTIDTNRLAIDASIQRFEFCIELFWKNFKNFGALFGKESPSPRDAIMTAFALKWIDNEHLWLSMLKDRNATSHTYKKIKADEIYARIHLYYPEMCQIYNRLQGVIKTLS